ncbi:MAG: hypothetical protein AAB656_03345 [Patescibacteria group bacterium]
MLITPRMLGRFTVSYYPYPARDAKTGKVIEYFRPSVPVQISKGNQRSFIFQALVDSGSDRNLFPAKFGEQIGLDIRSGNKYHIEGIGKYRINVYTHIIGFHLYNINFQTEADFCYEQEIPLLGRIGFFDKFKKVSFKEKKRMVEFKT